MNYLFIVDNITPGGGNYALLKYAESLANLGHNTYVCTTRPAAFLSKSIQEPMFSSFTVIRRPRVPRLFKGFGLLDRVWTRIYDRYFLKRIVNTRGINWIIGMQQLEAVRAVRISKICGIRVGNFAFESPQYTSARIGHTKTQAEQEAMRWKPFKDALSSSDLVFFNSETTRDEVKRWTRISRSEIIYLGVDFSSVDARPSKEKNYQLVYIGRLVQYKNVSEILYALSQIENPPSLMIYGDGPIRSELQQLATDLGVTAVFHGWVSETKKWDSIRGSLFMVFPSSFGGLPPAEALYCKIPCVCADVAFNRELYGDHVEYFEEHNIDQLADVISTLLGNKSYRVESGQRGYEYVKSKFSWHEGARRIVDSTASIT